MANYDNEENTENEEDEINEEKTHGESIKFEDGADDGYHFLDYLSSDEADVFFYYARNHSDASFQDKSGHRYSLRHEGGNRFTLTER